MKLHRLEGGGSLIEGDSRQVLQKFSADRFDSCVTDGPYELGFMGKAWDSTGIVNDPAFWAEVLRVLKPGGHLLSFGHSRTSHRMTCAIEDAGFEIRDSIDWLYGTGFPKSKTHASGMPEGQGTALMPGKEPIVMGRKPLIGTLEENIAAFGTAGLRIDECRVPRPPRPLGGWPKNVILDEDAAAELDEQTGVLTSGKMKAGQKRAGRQGVALGVMAGDTTTTTVGDSGGASRFFYVAKPSRAERDQGCAHLPAKTGGEATDRADDSAGTQNPRAGAGRNGGARNFHPTVKPVDLMRYLVRLVTPAGGCVLDPFTGSGTTGMAARLEGLDFVGIEREPEYATIAAARIAGAA